MTHVLSQQCHTRLQAASSLLARSCTSATLKEPVWPTAVPYTLPAATTWGPRGRPLEPATWARRQRSICRAFSSRLSAVSHTLHSSQSLAVRLTCRSAARAFHARQQ